MDDAALLGLELPPFEGPLIAFGPGGKGAPGDPIYLGGDLHAVHPDAADRRPGRRRDHFLERARVAIRADECGIVEDTAVEGVWCLALHGEFADAAPYLSILDTGGRMRACLLLPPARLMVGIGHFWLPSVPPPGSGAPDAPPRA